MGLYSSPAGTAVSAYETSTLDPGRGEISVNADDGVRWQIVAVINERLSGDGCIVKK